MNRQKATFGAGCFWCVEAIFQAFKGVHSVLSGYAGGHTESPTYEQVCGGATGHAEVAQITFDPNIISFETLLHIFWRAHDPTTLNRQGADRGSQYRSAIFYHSDEQKNIAQKSLMETGKSDLWPNPIVTEITALDKFYPAEAYHNDYFRRNQNQAYCSAVIAPKVQKMQKDFKDMLKQV